jgi:hypothetical protein
LAILERLDGLETWLKTALPSRHSDQPEWERSAESASGNDENASNSFSNTQTNSIPVLDQANGDSHISFESPGQPQTAEIDDLSSICGINVEAVLSWPILGIHTSPATAQSHLKNLLRSDTPSSNSLPLSIVEVETADADLLLQRFLEHVHVYNPVLEIDRIKESVRFTLYNGLGWDAKSSLLVSKLSGAPLVRPLTSKTKAY